MEHIRKFQELLATQKVMLLLEQEVGIRDKVLAEFIISLSKSSQTVADFEKALAWLEQRGLPDRLVILGGLGKRTDHCFSNLMIAARVDPSVEIIFDDEHEWIRRINPACPLVLSGRADTPLSLLPVGEVERVNSFGLQWELVDSDFSWDRMISQSNRCATDEVKVSCQSGVLYAFVSKET